jgi:hypothetical protein
MQDTKLGTSEKDSPAQVAKAGYDALMAGKDHVMARSVRPEMSASLIRRLSAAGRLHLVAASPGLFVDTVLRPGRATERRD